MDEIGSSQGCRYCGRPVTVPAPGSIGDGPPQVLCASCRASSSLDSLVGLGAFASGGIALKVPRAQASAQDPGHHVPPTAPGAGPVDGAHRGERRPDDVVIDLTDAAMARAADAAAALEGAPAPTAPEPEAPEPPGGHRTRAAEEGDEDGAPGDGPGGSDRTAEIGSIVDEGEGGGPRDPDQGGAAPRRPERNPTIRDLTRGTGRSRSTPRRAQPLTPAPRAERPPAAPQGRPARSLLDPGQPSPGTPGPTTAPGRGRRRPTIIDLRDGAPDPTPRAPVGPQWSGTKERDALRALLEDAADRGVHVLHDRRAPGCLSAIDHLVVAPSGVWVVDSMGFSGKVRASSGGRLRGRRSLHMGGRDRTPLLDDVTTRVQAVRTALADSPEGGVPFRGALCFSDEDLGRATAPVELDGVLVTSRRHLLRTLTGEDRLDGDRRAALLRAVSERIPPIA